MTLPQILVDLMKLLFDMAVPVAICMMVLAGIALRQEGGVNFQAGGRFQRWALWSVIMLTLPQFLSWFAAQGILMPPQGGNISSAWVNSVETSFTGFVSNVVVVRLIPVLAAFCILKAALDAAEGHSPLGSIIGGIFLLSVSGTVQLMQSWNSGSTFATTDMLRRGISWPEQFCRKLPAWQSRERSSTMRVIGRSCRWLRPVWLS
jgi:hypothetical protein